MGEANDGGERLSGDGQRETGAGGKGGQGGVKEGRMEGGRRGTSPALLRQ